MNPEKVDLKDLKVFGFWSHKPEKYPKDRQWFSSFSNWFLSSFVIREFDDVQDETNPEISFIMIEQYMMWMKARRYKDYEIAEKILKETDPAAMKDLGRKVKNYNDKDWSKVRYDIVKRGLLAKFQQNECLKQNLLRTDDKILAECSKFDRIWGIGLAPNNPETQDVNKWLGQNLLGKGLMEIRSIVQV